MTALEAAVDKNSQHPKSGRKTKKGIAEDKKSVTRRYAVRNGKKGDPNQYDPNQGRTTTPTLPQNDQNQK